ncbi:MAG: glycosyltransferase [Chloroflexi bacterium]|nr:glycosyltransferase [Chloroflexota bacterium]
MQVSVVIPVYNEVQCLPTLHKGLREALNSYPTTWEVVYVDDGSRDGSLQALEILAGQDPQHTRVVALRRNFGQTAAISAGIDYACGDIIVLMDSDLQNDPADIPMLLDKIAEGYDLVSGWRKARQDAFITRTLPSRAANWLISQVTGVHLHDYGCTLKAYRREVLTGFRLYGEMHRFIPAYAGYVGARVTEVVVRHHPRRFGKTNYGLNRTIKVVLDLFTVKFLSGYVNKPIYLFGGFGLGLMSISGAGFLYLAYRKFLFGAVTTTSPIFLLSIMLTVLGAQSILLGLIAEIVVRTYHESQAKPIYTVRYVIHGEEPGSKA